MNKFDVRVVLRDPDRLGLYWYGRFTGTDLYAGCARRQGREVFRFSYHDSGTRNVHSDGTSNRWGRAPRIVEVRDNAVPLGTWGRASVDLTYPQQLKADTATRRTIIVDHLDDVLRGDEWATIVWAVDADRRDLAEKVMTRPEGDGIWHAANLHVDWTRPHFVVQVVSFESFEPGSALHYHKSSIHFPVDGPPRIIPHDPESGTMYFTAGPDLEPDNQDGTRTLARFGFARRRPR